MLQKIGKTANQIVLGAVVILLSLVFALQFGGPQAEGCSSEGGILGARAGGKTVTEGDFRANFALAGFDRYASNPAQAAGFKKITMDGLIERNLLAEKAEQVGLAVNDKEVMVRLTDKGTALLTLGPEAPPGFPDDGIPLPVKDADGGFDSESAKRFVRYGLRRTLAEFLEAQHLELLAHRMRSLVKATTGVSEGQIRAEYIKGAETATVQYVRFTPGALNTSAPSTDAEVKAWMSSHADQVNNAYDEKKDSLKDLPPQIHFERVDVPFSTDETDQGVAEKENKLKLAERIRGAWQGDVSASDLAARFQSADPDVQAKSNRPFVDVENLPTRIKEATTGLKTGEVSAVVESSGRFSVIRVRDRREGTVPEDKAKLQIARELQGEDRAKRVSRDHAITLLRLVKSQDETDVGKALKGMLQSLGQEEDSLKVEEPGPFGRAESPFYGKGANELVDAVFSADRKPGPMDQVFDLDGSAHVIVVKERTFADPKGPSDERREELRKDLLEANRKDNVTLLAHMLRAKAQGDGRIEINQDLLQAEVGE